MTAEQAVRRRRVLTRYSAEDREQLIEQQAQSGLTRKAFCERHGVNLCTFYAWSKRRRPARQSPAFAEVELATCTQAAVEVLLPNGARVGIRHHGKREDLVTLIRGVAGC